MDKEQMQWLDAWNREKTFVSHCEKILIFVFAFFQIYSKV